MAAANKIQVGYIEPQDGAQFKVDEGTAAAPGICFVDSTATGLYSPGTGQIAWSTSGKQTALRILADGKVGIDCSPTVALEVNGTIKASAIDAPIEGTLDDWIVHAGDTNTKFGFPAVDKFSVETNGAERFRIISTGKISNTYDGTPSDPQYGQLELLKNGASNADPDWSYLSFHRIGQIAWQQGIDSNDFVIAKTGGSAKDTLDTERLRIKSTGEVGINVTPASGNLLHVKDTDADTIIKVESEVGYDARLKLDTSSGGGAEARIDFEEDASIRGFISYTNNSGGTTDDMIFGTATSEKLRINSVGDALFGNHGSRIFDDTSATNVVVDVYGGTTAGKRGILSLSGRTGSDNADIGTIWFANENNAQAGTASHVQSKLVASIDVKSETSDSNSGSDSGGHLLFSTKPETGQITERLRITSDGDMGLGANNPGADPAIGNDATVFEIRQTTTGTLQSGNNRKGAVLRLKHEAQWENGYQSSNPNDDLGRIEFVTGDNSTGEGVRSIIRTRTLQYFNHHALTFETAYGNSATMGERLRLVNDVASFGNGALPDWQGGGGYYNIQLGNSGYFRADTDASSNFLSYGVNAYRDGSGWKFVENGRATQLTHQDGKLTFHGSNSGNAGNAITFAEHFRIDENGKLLIGKTRTQYANDYYDDITINNNGGSGAAGGCGITMISSASSWGALQFGDGDDDDCGYIKYDHNANKIIFGVEDGSVRFWLTKNKTWLGTTGHGDGSRSTLLDIVGVNQDPHGAWGQMGLYSSDSVAQDKGGSITFGGHDGSIARQYFAGIHGAKENGTSGNYAGNLNFFTRPSGSTPVRRLRIESWGSLTAWEGPSQHNGNPGRLASGHIMTWNSTHVSGGLAVGWYPIIHLTDGCYLILLKTGAHSSMLFTASNGYDPSNLSYVNVLHFTHNPNSSYLNVDGVRATSDGVIEIHLNASSSDYFEMQAQILGPEKINNTLSFYSTLTKQTGSPTINDSKYPLTYQGYGGAMQVENLRVDGSFSKAAGSFRIPHPLPALKDTKDLAHSFIEGPQCDNIYRGKIDLVDGTATVNLDTKSNMTEGTFVALNRDVQCYTSNETGWTNVKGSVSGNTLTITAQDNSCTDTISWMVVGERQDDSIKSGKCALTDDDGNLIVEPDKFTNSGQAPDDSKPNEI